MNDAITKIAKRTIAGRNYLTPIQFAEVLGCATQSIYRWDAEGKLPPRMKIGRRFFYSAEAVQAWLTCHESVGDMGKPE